MKAFHELSDSNKAAYVYRNGDFVTSIEYYNMKLNLFSVGKIFIEIRFDMTGEFELIRILDDRGLAIYLNRIHLSDLGVPRSFLKR